MQIHIHRDGQQYGPYSLQDITKHVRGGTLTPEDWAWYEGAADWMPLEQVPGISLPTAQFAQPPPSVYATTAATRSKLKTVEEAFSPPPLSAFHHPTYLVRRKIFKLFGASFHIYDPQGNVAFYSKQKAFKLKEDIRVYSSEDQRQELLVIRARNILDFAGTYDVFDPNQGNAQVGTVKRKGLKSILVDEWQFLDVSGREIGLIKEDSVALALLRRVGAGWLLPQTYLGSVGQALVCRFKRNFNPFVSKVALDFTPDMDGLLDRRLGIAAAVLLVAIEQKQS